MDTEVRTVVTMWLKEDTAVITKHVKEGVIIVVSTYTMRMNTTRK